MGIISASYLVDVGIFIITLCFLVYIYFDHVFKHWKKRGVPYVEPSMFFGNLKPVISQEKHLADNLVDLYMAYPEEKVIGTYFFGKPTLLIRDVELVKNVLVKDFDYFQDHDFKVHEDLDQLNSKTLFFSRGHRWKKLRAKLSPAFTSGKVKKMFPLFLKSTDKLKKFLEMPAETGQVLNIKDIFSRASADVIGSCAFGIEFDSLKDPSCEFFQMGQRVFKPSSRLAQFKIMVVFFVPALAKILRIRLVEQEVEDFFRRVVKQNVEYRTRNDMTRGDFMDLLIELKKKGHVEEDEDDRSQSTKEVIHEDFSMDDLTAQVLAFFSAGFETQASTMTFALCELAVNPDIQERLWEEIQTVTDKYGGSITYEAVQEMEYLDKIISETLRKYLPAPGMQIGRECTKDYRIPGTSITIERGTSVHIPGYAIHHDPKYYPEPGKFDPERFNEHNRKARPNYTYLPFGEGPRFCIGMRFALLQMKVCLAVLITSYEFRVSDTLQVPLKLDPAEMNMNVKGGSWLRLSRRQAKS